MLGWGGAGRRRGASKAATLEEALVAKAADAREVGFALLNLIEGIAQVTPPQSTLELRVTQERGDGGAVRVTLMLSVPLADAGEPFPGTAFVRSVFEACGGGLRWLPVEEGMHRVLLWLPEVPR